MDKSNEYTKKLETKLKINGQEVWFLIDTGASVNILDEKSFDRINTTGKPVTITKSNTKIFAYGSKAPLQLLGTFEETVETSKKISLARFHVAKNLKGNLLSSQTAQDLHLIKINIHSVQQETKTATQTHSAKPTVNSPSYVNHLLKQHKKKVEEELKRLEEDDIIGKVEGATQWLTLAEESRNLTTFTTHKGLRRYKRLCFGVNSAAEIFQDTISQTIQDISNAKDMSDDVIIWGTTLEEHNTALEKVLQRFEEKGITLNEGKCRFNKTRLQFFGLVFSKVGVSPDPSLVQDLAKTQPPKNVSEV
eukprot:gene9681-17451_t